MTQRDGTYHITPQRIIEVGGEPVRPVKPAFVRKPTVVGMAAVTGPQNVDQRSHAIETLLASYRGRREFLEPRTRDLEKQVTVAMAAVGRKNARTSVISLEKYRQLFGDLPYSVRGDAYAGLRQGIENGLTLPTALLLKSITGFEPKFDRVFQPPAVKELVTRASERLGEALGDIAPKSIISGFADVLGNQLLALANGSTDLIRKIQPFAEMWHRGHAPVGLLTDHSFLVIVK